MYTPNFKRGDIIAFGDKEFIVIDNYGPCGKVIMHSQNGRMLYDILYWECQGKRAILVYRSGFTIEVTHLLIVFTALVNMALLIVLTMQVI